MTAKKPCKKNQFQKGNTKSVGYGRPRMTEAQKELSITTRTKFKEMLNKYMVSEKSELEELLKRKDIIAIDCMVIQSLVNALNSGNQVEINWFLNHTLGKEKETTHVHMSGGLDNTNAIDIGTLSKEDALFLKGLNEKNREV